jgi:hypothetical protein
VVAVERVADLAAAVENEVVRVDTDVSGDENGVSGEVSQ